MVRLLVSACLVLGSALLYSQPSLGQIIDYQGVLNDASGQPIEGVVDVSFRIYPSLDFAGRPLWIEQHSLMLEQGRFSVTLGNDDAFPETLFDQPVALGIQVGDDPEMQPRQLITHVPMAINARRLNGVIVEELVVKDRSRIYEVLDVETTENFATARAFCEKPEDWPMHGYCSIVSGELSTQSILNWSDPNELAGWECVGSRNGTVTVTARMVCQR